MYDTLATLSDKELLRRIQPAGSPARYENRTGDNHHHLICRSCRVLYDIDCAVGDTPCLTADDDHGFDIDEAEVVAAMAHSVSTSLDQSISIGV